MMNVGIPSDVMFSVLMLNFILLNVIMLNVIMQSTNAKCHYVKCWLQHDMISVLILLNVKCL